MNIIQWLEANLDVGIVDIEHAAQSVGVDIVDGISLLEKVFAPVSADLSAVGEILSITDPALASIVEAITQVVGLITASSKITESLVSSLSDPATVQTDYQSILANFAKFKAIEAAQILSIQKALSLIVPIAVKAKSSTVAEIENAIKSL